MPYCALLAAPLLAVVVGLMPESVPVPVPVPVVLDEEKNKSEKKERNIDRRLGHIRGASGCGVGEGDGRARSGSDRDGAARARARTSAGRATRRDRELIGLGVDRAEVVLVLDEIDAESAADGETTARGCDGDRASRRRVDEGVEEEVVCGQDSAVLRDRFFSKIMLKDRRK